MSDKTGIEWTDATWNPIRGCSRVSEGCRHCYAESQAARIIAMDRGRGVPEGKGAYDGLLAKGGQWNGAIRMLPGLLTQPIRWTKPRKIFVNSMSDLFHESVPFEFVAAVFGVMASTPRHTYQVLTKRPQRMLEFFSWLAQKAEGANERYMNSSRYRRGVEARQALRDQGRASLDEPRPPTEMVRGLYDIATPIISPYMDGQSRYHHLQHLGERHWRSWPLDNVWLGVSVEDQATAEERIPLLLETPAAVRWLSMEPLLGPVCFAGMWIPFKNPAIHVNMLERLDWVVVGGESGKKARPMHPDWARIIRDQCAGAEVPFLFKQWGEWLPMGKNPNDLDTAIAQIGQVKAKCYAWSDGESAVWVGKKAAGRALDGTFHDEYPGGTT